MGIAKVEVSLSIDENGILSWSAFDNTSEEILKCTFTRNQDCLSQEEIDKIIKDSDEHMDDNRQAR